MFSGRSKASGSFIFWFLLYSVSVWLSSNSWGSFPFSFSFSFLCLFSSLSSMSVFPFSSFPPSSSPSSSSSTSSSKSGIFSGSLATASSKLSSASLSSKFMFSGRSKASGSFIFWFLLYSVSVWLSSNSWGSFLFSFSFSFLCLFSSLLLFSSLSSLAASLSMCFSSAFPFFSFSFSSDLSSFSSSLAIGPCISDAWLFLITSFSLLFATCTSLGSGCGNTFSRSSLFSRLLFMLFCSVACIFIVLLLFLIVCSSSLLELLVCIWRSKCW